MMADDVEDPAASGSEVQNILRNALTLLHGKRYADAASEYRKALPLCPNDDVSWSNLGTALRRLGHMEAALACARRALQLSGNKPEHLTNYGNILTDMDRKDEALAAHATAC